MLPTITQPRQTAILMSEEPAPIPEALIDLLLILRDDDERRHEMLRLLALSDSPRRAALVKLADAMREDPEAETLRQALHSAENPAIARALSRFLKQD